MPAGEATPPAPPSNATLNTSLKSSAARQCGNDWFRKACVDGLSPALQTLRFEKALKEYVTAWGHASLDEQLSSASKNIASAHWRLAVLHAPEEIIFSSSGAANRKQTLQRFLGHASDAEIKFKRALGEGGRDRGGRTGDWRSGVLGQLETVITVTKDMLVAGDGSLSAGEEDLKAFHESLRSMEDCHIKAFLYFLTGVVFFKKGVAAFSKNGAFDFKPCLSAMSESRPLLLAAERLASIHDDQELTERIGSYGEQVDMQQNDEEQPDMDMIWTIIDFYRRGVLLAKEKCLESEALAHSRLGVIYHKVLKQRSHAKKCFDLSLGLAESLYPKDLSGEDWHVAADHGITMIERVDSALRAGDAAKKEKLKGEIKDLLDPIEVIMGKGVDNVTKMRTLLKHIYSKHPPKLEAHSIGKLKPDKLKVTLTKSIMHYHTDTQQRYRPNADGASVDSKGNEISWGAVESFEKWELLCGEICRHLNFLYTYTYKSC